jgi:ATP-dependent Clp protease ATP-binding subunit ClpC
VIIFTGLSLKDVEQIVILQMKEISERLAEQGLAVELTDEARYWLADHGFDPQFGARPLRRALQRFVESPLSVSLLKGDFRRGDLVIVDVDPQKSEITFVRREGAATHLVRPPSDLDLPEQPAPLTTPLN